MSEDYKVETLDELLRRLKIPPVPAPPPPPDPPKEPPKK